MQNLENITSVVPPTSLIAGDTVSIVSIKNISDQLLQQLTSDQSDMFKEGRACSGSKPSTPTSILRGILYKEVEQLQIVKDTGNIENTVNIKTRKALLQQIDNVINLFEMSINTNSDSVYFMLGLILRTLYKK